MSVSSREASASWMFRGCGEWLVVVGAAGGLGVLAEVLVESDDVVESDRANCWGWVACQGSFPVVAWLLVPVPGGCSCGGLVQLVLVKALGLASTAIGQRGLLLLRLTVRRGSTAVAFLGQSPECSRFVD